VRVIVTIEREFEMDEARILGRSDFAPPPADADADTKRDYLRESFFELCGVDRELDHVDGSYVYLAHDSVDVHFAWPVGLAR
jgi:hypothetical protein